MQRALTPQNVINKKRNILKLEGDWLGAMGELEMGSKILIWGGSGQGKTDFSIQLGGMLSHFGKVAFNSLEMGDSKALADALQRHGVKKNFIIVRDNTEQLVERLQRRKSPDIVIIDSLQYQRDAKGNTLNYRRYQELAEALKEKIMVFISHADGREPSGRVAKSVRFDADCKVFVKGFRAFTTSRYGGGQPFTIAPALADEYWGMHEEE